MSAPNLGPVSTLLLTIIEERADIKTTPNNVSSNVGTQPDNKILQRRESNTKLPVERWPGFLGPFVMMVLTMRRRNSAADCGQRDDGVLPQGARFVVRCSSR